MRLNFFCIFLLLPWISAELENIKNKTHVENSTNTQENRRVYNDVYKSLEVQTENTGLCKRADYLLKILTTLVPILKNEVPEKTKTSYVLEILKDLLRSSPEAAHDQEVMYKINDLLKTLEKYNVKTHDSSNSTYILRKTDDDSEERSMMSSNIDSNSVAEKMIFKFEVSSFHNPECTAALLRIVKVVHDAIKQLSNNPVCKAEGAITPQMPILEDVETILNNPKLNNYVDNLKYPLENTQSYLNIQNPSKELPFKFPVLLSNSKGQTIFPSSKHKQQTIEIDLPPGLSLTRTKPLFDGTVSDSYKPYDYDFFLNKQPFKNTNIKPDYWPAHQPNKNYPASNTFLEISFGKPSSDKIMVYKDIFKFKKPKPRPISYFGITSQIDQLPLNRPQLNAESDLPIKPITLPKIMNKPKTEYNPFSSSKASDPFSYSKKKKTPTINDVLLFPKDKTPTEVPHMYDALAYSQPLINGIMILPNRTNIPIIYDALPNSKFMIKEVPKLPKTKNPTELLKDYDAVESSLPTIFDASSQKSKSNEIPYDYDSKGYSIPINNGASKFQYNKISKEVPSDYGSVDYVLSISDGASQYLSNNKKHEKEYDIPVISNASPFSKTKKPEKELYNRDPIVNIKPIIESTLQFPTKNKNNEEYYDYDTLDDSINSASQIPKKEKYKNEPYSYDALDYYKPITSGELQSPKKKIPLSISNNYDVLDDASGDTFITNDSTQFSKHNDTEILPYEYDAVDYFLPISNSAPQFSKKKKPIEIPHGNNILNNAKPIINDALLFPAHKKPKNIPFGYDILDDAIPIINNAPQLKYKKPKEITYDYDVLDYSSPKTHSAPQLSKQKKPKDKPYGYDVLYDAIPIINDAPQLPKHKKPKEITYDYDVLDYSSPTTNSALQSSKKKKPKDTSYGYGVLDDAIPIINDAPPLLNHQEPKEMIYDYDILDYSSPITNSAPQLSKHKKPKNIPYVYDVLYDTIPIINDAPQFSKHKKPKEIPHYYDVLDYSSPTTNSAPQSSKKKKPKDTSYGYGILDDSIPIINDAPQLPKHKQPKKITYDYDVLDYSSPVINSAPQSSKKKKPKDTSYGYGILDDSIPIINDAPQLPKHKQPKEITYDYDVLDYSSPTTYSAPQSSKKKKPKDTSYDYDVLDDAIPIINDASQFSNHKEPKDITDDCDVLDYSSPITNSAPQLSTQKKPKYISYGYDVLDDAIPIINDVSQFPKHTKPKDITYDYDILNYSPPITNSESQYSKKKKSKEISNYYNVLDHSIPETISTPQLFKKKKPKDLSYGFDVLDDAIPINNDAPQLPKHKKPKNLSYDYDVLDYPSPTTNSAPQLSKKKKPKDTPYSYDVSDDAIPIINYAPQFSKQKKSKEIPNSYDVLDYSLPKFNSGLQLPYKKKPKKIPQSYDVLDVAIPKINDALQFPKHKKSKEIPYDYNISDFSSLINNASQFPKKTYEVRYDYNDYIDNFILIKNREPKFPKTENGGKYYNLNNFKSMVNKVPKLYKKKNPTKLPQAHDAEVSFSSKNYNEPLFVKMEKPAEETFEYDVLNSLNLPIVNDESLSSKNVFQLEVPYKYDYFDNSIPIQNRDILYPDNTNLPFEHESLNNFITIDNGDHILQNTKNPTSLKKENYTNKLDAIDAPSFDFDQFDNNFPITNGASMYPKYAAKFPYEYNTSSNSIPIINGEPIYNQDKPGDVKIQEPLGSWQYNHHNVPNNLYPFHKEKSGKNTPLSIPDIYAKYYKDQLPYDKYVIPTNIEHSNDAVLDSMQIHPGNTVIEKNLDVIKENVDIIEKVLPKTYINEDLQKMINKIKNVISYNQIVFEEYVDVINQYEDIIKQLKQLNINDELLNDLLLSMKNEGKLASPTEESKVLELTYLIRRPMPIVYQPYYYIKYQLPYVSSLKRMQQILSYNPHLKYNPAKIYKELIPISEVAELSPDLKGYDKNHIINLTNNDGILMAANVIKSTDVNMYATLDKLKEFNDFSIEDTSRVINNFDLNLDQESKRVNMKTVNSKLSPKIDKISSDKTVTNILHQVNDITNDIRIKNDIKVKQLSKDNENKIRSGFDSKSKYDKILQPDLELPPSASIGSKLLDATIRAHNFKPTVDAVSAPSLDRADKETVATKIDSLSSPDIFSKLLKATINADNGSQADDQKSKQMNIENSIKLLQNNAPNTLGKDANTNNGQIISHKFISHASVTDGLRSGSREAFTDLTHSIPNLVENSKESDLQDTLENRKNKYVLNNGHQESNSINIDTNVNANLNHETYSRTYTVDQSNGALTDFNKHITNQNLVNNWQAQNLLNDNNLVPYSSNSVVNPNQNYVTKHISQVPRTSSRTLTYRQPVIVSQPPMAQRLLHITKPTTHVGR